MTFLKIEYKGKPLLKPHPITNDHDFLHGGNIVDEGGIKKIEGGVIYKLKQKGEDFFQHSQNIQILKDVGVINSDLHPNNEGFQEYQEDENHRPITDYFVSVGEKHNKPFFLNTKIIGDINRLPENPSFVAINSCPCMFSSNGAFFVSENGEEIVTTEIGARKQLNELKIVGLKINPLSFYEIEGALRLANTIKKIHNPNISNKVLFNPPVYEYALAYLWNFVKKGCLNGEIAIEYLNACLERSVEIRKIYSQVFEGTNISIEDNMPLAPLHEFIVERYTKLNFSDKDKGAILGILKEKNPQFLEFYGQLPNRYFEIPKLDDLSYKLAELKAAQSVKNGGVGLVVEDPNERKIISGLQQDLSKINKEIPPLIGIYPLSKVIIDPFSIEQTDANQLRLYRLRFGLSHQHLEKIY